jgi:hypothetical protein
MVVGCLIKEMKKLRRDNYGYPIEAFRKNYKLNTWRIIWKMQGLNY